MPKRKCTFNSNLQTTYPFIKQGISPYDVRCEKCRSEFSVSHGGKSDIENHLKSEKHKRADRDAASSSSMVNFFKNNNPTTKDLDVAAAEGVWAYHTIQENHSFRSNDCTNKLIQLCFEQKYNCARTKIEAIVVNVLAPMTVDDLTKDLSKANCVAISTDASNHGNTKIFPILVRYFLPYEGIKVKILEVQEQPGETSDIIVNYLMKVLSDKKLTDKVVAFCGDNTNCNFGGASRKGVNNVFAKLKAQLKKNIIGVGCGAHLIHNAMKSAADCLPVDIEVIIVKLYSFFYIYTIRVEALKDFCDQSETEYKQLLGYSKTRWLALLPAVERVIDMYQPLKNYFLSIEKCPSILKDFFSNPYSELWLYFIQAQASSFQKVVLNIEGQHIVGIEAASEINNFKDTLFQKMTNQFLPHKVRTLLDQIIEDASIDMDENLVKKKATEFYKTSFEYLTNWTEFTKDLELFSWANLKTVPKWSEFEKTFDIMVQKGFLNSNQDTPLIEEYSLILKYVTIQKVTEWNEQNIPLANRWVELFQHFRNNNINHNTIQVIIEYILCLPGTNAPVERVFSLMNNLWTKEKSQLNVSTLKSMLIIKVNVEKSCQEFHSYLKSQPTILKQICSSEKYKKN